MCPQIIQWLLRSEKIIYEQDKIGPETETDQHCWKIVYRNSTDT